MTVQNALSRSNDKFGRRHEQDFNHLRGQLEDRGVDVDSVLKALSDFEVAVPSWALGTGGTRFGKFPVPGQPRNVFEKFDDIGLIQKLVTSTPSVSLHIPWDEPEDPQVLRDHAAALNLGFDAVNSNTFQDQAGQSVSYRFGSLCHTEKAVRQYAIDHVRHTIDVGKTLDSKAITVWLADGSNYPGQMHLRKSFQRTLEALQDIYEYLPPDWQLFTEHKPYEPAFYATVVQDWGSSLLLAQQLGDRAKCLVDLGHHLPNTNIELVVARLVDAGKLGGFHFNDSKYGDDDLTTGSIKPFQLFLVFNELVDAADDDGVDFNPSYMIDQSHNIKDPIEALIQTVEALQQSYAKALIVDRDELGGYQNANDVLMAEKTLQAAYETDVRPLVAELRRLKGGAFNPVHAFRESGYRDAVSSSRDSGDYVPPQSL